VNVAIPLFDFFSLLIFRLYIVFFFFFLFTKTAICLITLICAVGFPMVLALGLPPATQEVLVGTCFFIAGTFSMLIFFGRKAYLLYSGADLNGKLQIVRKGDKDRAKTKKEKEDRMREVESQEQALDERTHARITTQFLLKLPDSAEQCDQLISVIRAKLTEINLKAIQDSGLGSSSNQDTSGHNSTGGGGGGAGGGLGTRGSFNGVKISTDRRGGALGEGNKSQRFFGGASSREASVKSTGPEQHSHPRLSPSHLPSQPQAQIQLQIQSPHQQIAAASGHVLPSLAVPPTKGGGNGNGADNEFSSLDSPCNRDKSATPKATILYTSAMNKRSPNVACYIVADHNNGAGDDSAATSMRSIVGNDELSTRRLL
jgi:uncharacterized membrane protein YgcG